MLPSPRRDSLSWHTFLPTLLLTALAACGPDAPGDTTAPTTRFTSTPAAQSAQSEASFAFEASEPDVTFSCALDDAPATTCASPHRVTDLADGPHRLVVTARDAAGNTESEPPRFSWTVDLTPPETSLDLIETVVNEGRATFAFSANEPASFDCALDQGAFEACDSPVTVASLASGPHTFVVRARDLVGHVDGTPARHDWVVDVDPPETTFESVYAPTDLSTATFAFVSEEGATFECALDDGPFAACVSPLSLEALADGERAFMVRARDAANNVDPTPARHAWVIDTSPADTTLTQWPQATSTSHSATFEFTADRVDCTFTCRLDDGDPEPCVSPFVRHELAGGPHHFSVAATNPAGRTDETPATYDWVIALPPVTVLSEAPADSRDTTATFTFTSEPGATFECRLDDAEFVPCTSPQTLEGLAHGTHTFVVRATGAGGLVEDTPPGRTWTTLGFERLRVVAANLTSGNGQSYDPGHGARILTGINPDVVLIQEFNYGTNSVADIRSFVTETFDASFDHYREGGAQIPNGIISRHPIIESGEWDDTSVSNRDFAWARIDVPGPRDLWVVSVHLLTSGSTTRNTEAKQLVEYITENVPTDDYLVIGGDLNTDSRSESCISTLSGVVSTSGPYPADQNGSTNTNASRSKPYDWVLADPDLTPLSIPVVIGTNTFDAGLVVDTRVYSPLSEIAPAIATDSGATSMQHMAVVRDFELPLQ